MCLRLGGLIYSGVHFLDCGIPDVFVHATLTMSIRIAAGFRDWHLQGTAICPPETHMHKQLIDLTRSNEFPHQTLPTYRHTKGAHKHTFWNIYQSILSLQSLGTKLISM